MVANGGGAVQWTTAMSSFILTFLSELVANGTKTSTGFKQVHLNACAKALNETMGTNYTGNQVANHLRKWKRIYGKVEKLKNLSAAQWVEDTCTISLEKDHYAGHVKVSFLNYDSCYFVVILVKLLILLCSRPTVMMLNT